MFYLILDCEQSRIFAQEKRKVNVEGDKKIAVHKKVSPVEQHGDETGSDILMSSGGNDGARKKNEPPRDGRDGSPSRPSRKVGGLGDPSLPIIVSTPFLKPQAA